MSERKVLNKYYPPDFDASKLPRVKREKNRQFVVRLMAPFNMRCKTCGEYIYRGKKFNSRKEDVIGRTYLGIQIYRFYIKCTKCLAEITFLTDPENQDYEMENGAIRNFESLRLAEKQAEAEAKQLKEEEENNPMKILENRTRDSRREMAVLETLEDLRELNAASLTVDPKILFEEDEKLRKQIEEQEREEDEAEIRRIFGNKKKTGNMTDIILDEEASSDEDNEDVDDKEKLSNLKHKILDQQTDDTISKKLKTSNEDVKPAITSTSVLFPTKTYLPQQKPPVTQKSQLASLIKKKQPEIKTEPAEPKLSISNQAGGASQQTSKQENSTYSKQAVSSLSSLLNAYDDSDSNDSS